MATSLGGLVIALICATFTSFSNAQVDNYAANGQNYFIDPPIPVYGPGDYTGIKSHVQGEQWTVTWNMDKPYVWLVIAQEGNPNTRTLAANTSATSFIWDASVQFQTSADNETFFLVLYDEPRLLYPYLAISQYFNITKPVASSTSASPTSSTSSQSLNPAQQPTDTTLTSLTSTATSSATSAAAAQSTGSSGLSQGTSIGIGVGVGVGVALIVIAAGVWFLRKRSQKKKNLQRMSGASNGYPMSSMHDANGALPYTDHKSELPNDPLSPRKNHPSMPAQEMP